MDGRSEAGGAEAVVREQRVVARWAVEEGG